MLPTVMMIAFTSIIPETGTFGVGIGVAVVTGASAITRSTVSVAVGSPGW
jgi:hypothetical protein